MPISTRTRQRLFHVHQLQALKNENIKKFSPQAFYEALWKHQKRHRYDNLFKFLSVPPWQLFLPNMKFFLSFCLRRLFSNNPRRHILSFNLALFILFWSFFSYNVEREMDKNHARHYPTPKLLRLLCFMGNAIYSVCRKNLFLFCLFKLRARASVETFSFTTLT